MIRADKPFGLELLTVAEAANCLRVSRSLVYQLVESGRLAAHRLGQGRGAVRIKMDDLVRYVESCRSECGEPVMKPARRRESLRHLKV